MKKIISLSIFVAALFLASSCVKEEAGEQQGQTAREVILDASAATKSVLDGNSVKWEDGDCISLVFTHPSKASSVTEFSTKIEGGQPALKSKFRGNLSNDVTSSGGYASVGYAVYPSTAVGADGKVSFILPDVQTAKADGSFQSGMNLSSSAVALADLDSRDQAQVSFHNALSIIRFTVASDVTSVTLTGTAPFAGGAPLNPDLSDSADGRLSVVSGGTWNGAKTSVTLVPPAGSECFSKGVVYNLLVWPGTHSSLTATVNFKEYGDYVRSSKTAFTLHPSKFYTLDLQADSESIVTELQGAVGEIESDIDEINGRLEALSDLMSQIQSVAVMPEYAENIALAPYSLFSSSKKKEMITLDYMVRPASAASELVSRFADAMSAQVCYRSDSGNLSFASLPLKSAEISDDILTVNVNADGLSDSFYNGNIEALMALQISDGKTDILSDYVTLVPKLGGGIDIRRTENIPVMKGATLAIPFKFAVSSSDYSLSVTSEGIDASDARISFFDASKTGYVYLTVKDTYNVSDIRVNVLLDSGGEVFTLPLTFSDGGSFDVTVSGVVDYIGGEVSVSVTNNSFGSYALQLNTGGWIYQTTTGVNGHYTVDYNNGGERKAVVEYTINTNDPASNGSLQYVKYVDIVQRAYNTPLLGEYFADGQSLALQTATASVANKLNLVILGDGYRKKELLKGGKFERSARSAMDSFFGVEPFVEFRNRFNVYMAAYESEKEGPRLESVSSANHKTYFETWYKGGGNTYVNYTDAGRDKVISAVKGISGLSSDQAYYRTVVILLVNTAENIGSTNYPSMTTSSITGDGYASFAIAMIAANSQGTGGLVRHEAGGHAFGRLGDEYAVDWYTSSLVNERHNVGFYRNVATSTSYWSAFKNAGYTDDEVMYDSYGSGVYRSTHEKGIMWNNNGQFNAVSRHAIYERIIKQTEGANAYSWDKFLQYDVKNR